MRLTCIGVSFPLANPFSVQAFNGRLGPLDILLSGRSPGAYRFFKPAVPGIKAFPSLTGDLEKDQSRVYL